MRAGGRTGRDGRRRSAAAWRSRFTAVVAALALLVQFAVAPWHHALAAPAGAATDVAAATAELRATFGGAVALCVETRDAGAPAQPAGDCGDLCPVCCFAAHAAVLLPPDLAALPARSRAVLVRDAAPKPDVVATAPGSRFRARAPPVAV